MSGWGADGQQPPETEDSTNPTTSISASASVCVVSFRQCLVAAQQPAAFDERRVASGNDARPAADHDGSFAATHTLAAPDAQNGSDSPPTAPRHATPSVQAAMEYFQTMHRDLENQYGRFNLWSSNMGIFADFSLSLDYRLRNDADIRLLIARMLDSVATQLADVASGCFNMSSRIQRASAGAVKVDDIREELIAIMESTTASFVSVSEDLGRLVMLTNAIRRSGDAHRAAKAATYPDVDGLGNDLKLWAIFAEGIVSRNFPGLSDPILKRLVASMTLRRRKLLYYSSHQRRKVLGPVAERPKQAVLQPMQSHRASTVVTSSENTSTRRPQPRPRVEFNAPVLDMPRPSSTVVTPFERQRFQRSTVTSMARTGRSLQIDKTVEHLLPPAPRVLKSEREVLCPLCGFLIPSASVATSRKWKNHVIRDIEPFVCLYEDCEHSTTLYNDAQACIDHIKTNHRTLWHCPIQAHRSTADGVFESLSDFEEHMTTRHATKFTTSQIKVLNKTSAKPAQTAFDWCPFEGDQCPIKAFEDSETTQQNGLKPSEQHVMNIMLELALLCIPCTGSPDDAWQDDGSGNETSSSRMRASFSSIGASSRNLGHDDISGSFAGPDEPQRRDTTDALALEGNLSAANVNGLENALLSPSNKCLDWIVNVTNDSVLIQDVTGVVLGSNPGGIIRTRGKRDRGEDEDEDEDESEDEYKDEYKDEGRYQKQQSESAQETRRAATARSVYLEHFRAAMSKDRHSWHSVKQLAVIRTGALYLERNDSTGQLRAVRQTPLSRLANLKESQETAALLISLSLEEPDKLCRVYDFWASDLYFHVAMEFFERGDLESYMVSQGKPLAEDEVSVIIGQILDALAYLHVEGLVHANLWVGSIFIVRNRPSWLVKIGESRLLRRQDSTTGLAQDGARLTAPEAYRLVPFNTIGTALDIWAVGSVAYELLTSRPLFERRDRLQEYCKAPHFLPGSGIIGPSPADLLHKLLTPSPKDRPTVSVARSHPWLYPIQYSATDAATDRSPIRDVPDVPDVPKIRVHTPESFTSAKKWCEDTSRRISTALARNNVDGDAVKELHFNLSGDTVQLSHGSMVKELRSLRKSLDTLSKKFEDPVEDRQALLESVKNLQTTPFPRKGQQLKTIRVAFVPHGQTVENATSAFVVSVGSNDPADQLTSSTKAFLGLEVAMPLRFFDNAGSDVTPSFNGLEDGSTLYVQARHAGSMSPHVVRPSYLRNPPHAPLPHDTDELPEYSKRDRIPEFVPLPPVKTKVAHHTGIFKEDHVPDLTGFPSPAIPATSPRLGSDACEITLDDDMEGVVRLGPPIHSPTQSVMLRRRSFNANATDGSEDEAFSVKPRKIERRRTMDPDFFREFELD